MFECYREEQSTKREETFKSLGKHLNRAKDTIDSHLSSGKKKGKGKAGKQSAHQTHSSHGESSASNFLQKAGGFAKKAVEIGMPLLAKYYKKGCTPKSNKKYGYKGSTIRDAGKGSSSQAFCTKSEDIKTWQEIRDECLESGTLWTDPDFGNDESSIFFKDPPSVWPDIEWKRPHEFCSDPVLFDEEGASRLDVNQGILGDCWLLAAVADLATHQKLLKRVVPDDQSFAEGEYAGVFRFNFWQYGRWVEVLIDDRLPTHNDKLIYMHSDNRNEFWTALLEKAYAKLNGNYECLSGGLTSEALTDFTGGVVERFELRDKAPEDLKQRLLKAHERYSLMGCSIDASPDQMEAHLDNGLIIGHAYSITGLKTISTDGGDVTLIRCRNPWGNENEWKGAWGDGSDEWNGVDPDTREELGLNFEHDGEFWMSFEDFVNEFQRLEVCYLGPDTLGDDDDEAASAIKWQGNFSEGCWKRRVNAGGCSNYPQTFHTNPQYRVAVDEPDDNDEDGKSTIIVGVMQKNRRKLRMEGKSDLTIGYCIYQLDDPDVPTVDRNYFRSHRPVVRSHAFINLREISGHHSLEPGHYIVVPSTFEPDEEGDFIMRIFSEKKQTVGEMDEDTSIGAADGSGENGEALGDDDDDDVGNRDAALESFLNLAGEDGELDAYEMQEILDTVFQKVFTFDGFSTDMCRGMVALYDEDLSGKLDYSDFKKLFADINLCKKAFIMVDEDKSGHFSSYELRRALGALGLRVSNATFNAIVLRFTNKEGQIAFDDFVACYIKLRSMFDSFTSKDEEGTGEATYCMDEFIQMTMYS